jgi:hypothetical protein
VKEPRGFVIGELRLEDPERAGVLAESRLSSFAFTQVPIRRARAGSLVRNETRTSVRCSTSLEELENC